MNTLKLEKELSEKYKYKKLSEKESIKYRQIYKENIPKFLCINGGNDLYTLKGTKLCESYDRIVIGDYGAFIEFSKPACRLVIEKGQEYRLTEQFKNVKYNWVTIPDGSHIKIYHQRGTVTYADYQVGKFYVSVHEVYNKKGEYKND